MVNRFKKPLLIVAILAFAPFVLAQQDRYEFETQQQEELFLLLNAELRCPKCQNQNIADSNALISQDMKRKVAQLVREGKQKDEVVDFMKQRYGDFVHYQPPLTAVTIWLYLLPVMFILVCFLLIKQRKNTSAQDSFNREEALKKAESALKDIE